MKFIKQLFISAITFFILSATANAALIHITDSKGILTGAKGVNINGTDYDVEFKDGTCVALFSGCDSKNDFLFNTSSSAYLASWVLNSYVFVNGWDSSPSKTKGCENSSAQCTILTPFELSQGWLRSGIFTNNDWINSDSYSVGNWTPTADTSSYAFTFAIWSLSNKSEVNESGSLAILIMSLAVLVGRRQLKNK